MGQISVEIMRLPGSLLSENQHSGSTLAGTTSWRPFLRAISTRASGFDGISLEGTMPGGSAETVRGMKEAIQPPPSSPVRYCRRQTVSRDREMPCRLAVALTCRFPAKLSSTIRTLSASFQCRRRTPSAADKTSIGGSNLRSRIRSELSLKRQTRQAAFPGGILGRFASAKSTFRDGIIQYRFPPSGAERGFHPPDCVYYEGGLQNCVNGGVKSGHWAAQ